MENFGRYLIYPGVFFISKRIITNLKLDLTRKDKLLMNSLGVAIGKETQECILATKIENGIIGFVRARRKTLQTFEKGGVTFSQELEITVLVLSYNAQTNEQ